jgi:hypothetical protein
MRIGTARVEESGGVSARFTADGEWSAAATSAHEVLRLVGRYLLTIDARKAAKDSDTESRPAKSGKTAEEKLSTAFLEKARAHRLGTLDQRLAAMRETMKALR